MWNHAQLIHTIEKKLSSMRRRRMAASESSHNKSELRLIGATDQSVGVGRAAILRVPVKPVPADAVVDSGSNVRNACCA